MADVDEANATLGPLAPPTPGQVAVVDAHLAAWQRRCNAPEATVQLIRVRLYGRPEDVPGVLACGHVRDAARRGRCRTCQSHDPRPVIEARVAELPKPTTPDTEAVES